MDDASCHNRYVDSYIDRLRTEETGTGDPESTMIYHMLRCQRVKQENGLCKQTNGEQGISETI